MAEWRLLRGWSGVELEARVSRRSASSVNFEGDELDMTNTNGWSHYYSEAVIARDADALSFVRARVALGNYRFSDPAIVVAHFVPDSELLERRILLEIRVLGLRYLCPAVVTRIRDEANIYGFRYDTLEGHIERGVEWFVLTRNAGGEITFRIEALWRRGNLPNWWSRVGFALLGKRYQRAWHREAHRRMSLLAQYGSLTPPHADVSGLTHQGVDVTFSDRAERTGRA